MDLYLGFFIPSFLLFLIAIFLQTHKYEATTSSIRLAKECSEYREKLPLKRWQLILGIILIFIPFVNMAAAFCMLFVATPSSNDEFIYIDNPKYKKLINYLKQDIW